MAFAQQSINNQSILGALIDMNELGLEESEKFDTVVIQVPIWKRDNTVEQNTREQLKVFYQEIGAITQFAFNLTKHTGNLLLFAQDTVTPLASIGMESDRSSNLQIPFEADQFAMQQAARRFVADTLNLVFERDYPLRYWPTQQDVIIKWSPNDETLRLSEVDKRAIYVLVNGDSLDEFRIIGWCEGYEITSNQIQIGSQPAFYIDRLSNIEILINQSRLVKPFELAGIPYRVMAMAQKYGWYLQGEFFILAPTWKTRVGNREHETCYVMAKSAIDFYWNSSLPPISSWTNQKFNSKLLGNLLERSVPSTGGNLLSIFLEQNLIKDTCRNLSFRVNYAIIQ